MEMAYSLGCHCGDPGKRQQWPEQVCKHNKAHGYEEESGGRAVGFCD